MNGFAIALKSELFIARHTFSSKLIVLAPAVLAVLQTLLEWITEAGQLRETTYCLTRPLMT